MTTCAATNHNGSLCGAQALKKSKFCFTHDPGSGAARAAAHRRGGQRQRVGHAGNWAMLPSQIRAASEVLTVLDCTLADARALENSVPRARLLVAICQTYLDAIKTGEFDARLHVLEEWVQLGGTKP